MELLKTVFAYLWGVPWSVLDEHRRKLSRKDPEPPYLPQSLIFLQENPQTNRQIKNRKNKNLEKFVKLKLLLAAMSRIKNSENVAVYRCLLRFHEKN